MAASLSPEQSLARGVRIVLIAVAGCEQTVPGSGRGEGPGHRTQRLALTRSRKRAWESRAIRKF